MDTRSLSDEAEHEAVDGAFLAQLAAGDRMSIQYFRIEPNAEVPRHSHEHEQTGFLYTGHLVFLLDDGEIAIGPGDSYAIPSEQPHAVVNRGDETAEGIDIFSPPRLDVPWA